MWLELRLNEAENGADGGGGGAKLGGNTSDHFPHAIHPVWSAGRPPPPLSPRFSFPPSFISFLSILLFFLCLTSNASFFPSSLPSLPLSSNTPIFTSFILLPAVLLPVLTMERRQLQLIMTLSRHLLSGTMKCLELSFSPPFFYHFQHRTTIYSELPWNPHLPRTPTLWYRIGSRPASEF